MGAVGTTTATGTCSSHNASGCPSVVTTTYRRAALNSTPGNVVDVKKIVLNVCPLLVVTAWRVATRSSTRWFADALGMAAATACDGRSLFTRTEQVAPSPIRRDQDHGMVMMCFCEIEGKSTLEYINSYIETFLLAEKHSPTTDLHIDDEKKNAIMNLGARKLTP